MCCHFVSEIHNVCSSFSNLNNFPNQSATSEAEGLSASQSVPVYKTRNLEPIIGAPVSVLSHVNLVHTVPPYSLKFILILFSHTRLVFRVISSLQASQLKCTHFDLTHACCMSLPSYPLLFDNPNSTSWRIQMKELLIMQLFSVSHYIMPCKSPHNLVSNDPRSAFLH